MAMADEPPVTEVTTALANSPSLASSLRQMSWPCSILALQVWTMLPTRSRATS